MKKLHIIPTTLTPEIIFSPDEKIFLIRGISSPEDVRALYYPVIEWVTNFSDEVLIRKKIQYTENDPLIFRIDLKYFNSSSAKFLHDIFNELKSSLRQEYLYPSNGFMKKMTMTFLKQAMTWRSSQVWSSHIS
jgi:hypothetical protein